MAQTDTNMIPIHEASQATAILFGKPMTAGELSNDDVAAVHAGFELEALIQSLNKYPETLEKAHNAIVITHARKVSQWGSSHLHASLGAAQHHPMHTRAWNHMHQRAATSNRGQPCYSHAMQACARRQYSRSTLRLPRSLGKKNLTC